MTHGALTATSGNCPVAGGCRPGAAYQRSGRSPTGVPSVVAASVTDARTIGSGKDVLSGNFLWTASDDTLGDTAERAAPADLLARLDQAYAYVRDGREKEYAKVIDAAIHQPVEQALEEYSEGQAQRQTEVHPVSAEATASQQEVAEAFLELGALRQRLRVSPAEGIRAAHEAGLLTATVGARYGASGLAGSSCPPWIRMGRVLIEDIAVPRIQLATSVREIATIAERHDVRIFTFTHAADGNLHPILVLDPASPDVPEAAWHAASDIFTTALRLGGTLTGEHGVGTRKRRWLARELGPEQHALQQRVKAAFDPHHILNPGKAL